jgi:hypothetical protein
MIDDVAPRFKGARDTSSFRGYIPKRWRTNGYLVGNRSGPRLTLSIAGRARLTGPYECRSRECGLPRFQALT